MKKKIKNKRKGIALLGVLIVVIFLGMLMATAFLSASTYRTSTLVKSGSDRALYCAQAGVEEALRVLRNGAGGLGVNWAGVPNPTDVFGTDPAGNTITVGQYTIVPDPIGPVPDGVWFNIPYQITGQAESLDGPDTVRRLDVVLRAMNPSSNMFTSSSVVRVRGGRTINGNVLGDRIFFDQASSANPTQVSGSVNFITSVDGVGPESNVQVGGQVNQVSNVVFPVINMSNFTGEGILRIPDGETLDLSAINPLTVSGGRGIIFAEGVLRVKGILSGGPLAIAAAGNILITDSVGGTFDTSAIPFTPDDPNVQLGLFSQGSVIIDSTAPQNLNINAFIMANQSFETNGAPNSKTQLNILGSVCVYGNNGGDASVFETGAYTNAAFDYNTNFQNNNRIPQMFYFANLLELAITGDPV